MCHVADSHMYSYVRMTLITATGSQADHVGGLSCTAVLGMDTDARCARGMCSRELLELCKDSLYRGKQSGQHRWVVVLPG